MNGALWTNYRNKFNAIVSSNAPGSKESEHWVQFSYPRGFSTPAKIKIKKAEFDSISRNFIENMEDLRRTVELMQETHDYPRDSANRLQKSYHDAEQLVKEGPKTLISPGLWVLEGWNQG